MTTEGRNAHAHLELLDKLRFAATFPESSAPPFVIDEAPPLGAGAGPNPAELLATAVGGCLAASLTFCLRKARVEPQDVVADAVAHIVRTDAGRFRVGTIDVDLSMTVSDSDRRGLERCGTLFEDFCIVTESVRHGIPVNVRVITPQADAVMASHPG